MDAFLNKDNMMDMCSRIFQAISVDPQMVQLSQSPDMNIKQLTLSIMRDVARDAQLSDMSVEYKNDTVVNVAKDFFRSRVSKTPQQDEVAMSEADIQSKMVAMAAVDVSIPPPATSTMEPLPALDRVYEEYISLDGGDRFVSLQPLRYAFSVDVDTLRTVSEVRVWSVIVPLTPKVTSSVCYRVNLTHVWLWVDEISGAFSKNKTDVAKRALCKLIVKSSHEPALGRGHLVLEPAMEEVRVFDPPLSSLSSFTISLRRPDGALLSDGRDDFGLVKVYQTSDAAANWIFEMDRLWEDDAFTKGDILRVRDVDTGFRELDDFLNRKEGHVVLTQGFPVGSAFKTVVVRKPGAVNQSTGEYEADGPLHVQLGNTNNAIKGRVVNMSMQVSVSLACKCNTTARHFDPSVHRATS